MWLPSGFWGSSTPAERARSIPSDRRPAGRGIDRGRRSRQVLSAPQSGGETVREFPNLVVLSHPLIQHKLTVLRSKETSKKKFQELVEEIAMLMAYEVTKDLPLEAVEIETPLETTVQQQLSGKKLTVVPILRAGLGMVDGVLKLMPSVRVGHIGLYRDHESLQPVDYYFKIPAEPEEREFILLDPMLATGGSAAAAVASLKRRGAGRINFMCVVAAPEGVERMLSEHPDVRVFTAALDRELDENGYIRPGLGDAGDRLFGTR
jgi:uracil phosphoribosyltransferase